MVELIEELDDGLLMSDAGKKRRVDEAHAYLESIRKMGEDCAALQQQVEDARRRADGISGIDYSRDVVQVSPTDDGMVNAVSSIMSAIREYTAALAHFEGERIEAHRAISSMDDYTEARALRLRYLLGYEWQSVCMEMHYSLDGMMKLRRRALLSFSYVMPVEHRERIENAI